MVESFIKMIDSSMKMIDSISYEYFPSPMNIFIDENLQIVGRWDNDNDCFEFIDSEMEKKHYDRMK